jgi:N-acetylglucosamine transport system substrate-binding protein
MEFLRVMLSRAGAAAFAREANSLTVLKDGIGPDVRLGPGTASTVVVLKAAGPHVFNYAYPLTHSQFDLELQNATGELMAGRVGPRAWLKRAKTAARKAKNSAF